jgi:hypothetical protein
MLSTTRGVLFVLSLLCLAAHLVASDIVPWSVPAIPAIVWAALFIVALITGEGRKAGGSR